MNKHYSSTSIVSAVLAQHFLLLDFDPKKSKAIATDVYETIGITFSSQEEADKAHRQAAIKGIYDAVTKIGEFRGFECGFVSGFYGFDINGNPTREFEAILNGKSGAAGWDAGRKLAVESKFEINDWLSEPLPTTKK